MAQNACHEKTLETLDLSVNELDNEGAIKICRAAAKHPKLCSLTLRGNKLTDQCATVFYELLKENRHIIHFDVDVADNKLSETTMIEIQRLLTLNRTPLVEESRRNNLY